jgi:hypothetical protein
MSERHTPAQDEYVYTDSFQSLGAGDYTPLPNVGRGYGAFLGGGGGAPGNISTIQVTRAGLVRWMFEITPDAIGAGSFERHVFANWGGPFGGRGVDAAAMAHRFRAGNLLLREVWVAWGTSSLAPAYASNTGMSPDGVTMDVCLDVQNGGGPSYAEVWRWSGNITVSNVIGTNLGVDTAYELPAYNELPIIVGPYDDEPTPTARLLAVRFKNTGGAPTTSGGTYRFIVTGTEM